MNEATRHTIKKMMHGVMTVMTMLCYWCMGTDMQAQTQQRPKVAVVLSGGGAKGMAHIGALKVIERAGIPIDIVAGTSMGSIVGGLYAVGWEPTRMDSLVRGQDWAFLLTDRNDYYSQNLRNREKQNTYFFTKAFRLNRKEQSASSGGFVEGKNLKVLFNRLTAGYNDSADFNKLPVPFACVATNIVDNSEYVFHQGRLAEAMRASMAIPGFFTPVRKDNMVLVDGGMRNNYPADVARQMGATYIIGVTLQAPNKNAEELVNGGSILGQIIDINCKNKYDDNLAITDILIMVDVKGYSSASFSNNAIDTLIRRGEEAAMKRWDELVALKKKLGLADDYKPQPRSFNEEAARPIIVERSKDALPKHPLLTGSVGLRFDTEEMVALQLNGNYRDNKKPLELDATLRLGKRIMARGAAKWLVKNQLKLGVDYTYRYNDIDFYYKGKKGTNTTYNHHQGTFSLAGMNIKNLDFDVSVRWDYYNYDDVMFNNDLGVTDVDVSDNHFYSYHANLHYNSENDWVFPTRGARFTAQYGYFTNDFVKYHGHRGFSEVNAMWRMAFTKNHLTIQPMLYGRMLFGSVVPTIRQNMIGGPWFGHYVEQQLPMAGMGRIEVIDRHFVACMVKGQYQLTDNNFVFVKVAAAQHCDRPKDLLSTKTMLGLETCYYYRTMFGPVGGSLGYNSYTKDPYFMINLGYAF